MTTELDISLSDLGVVDGPADSQFDAITELVSEFIKAPVALVSIVEPERDRQFFTSAVGLPEPWASRRQTPLSHSFCKHVRESNAPLVIEDARSHPLVRENGAVRDLNVIAYLGVPIHGVHGEPIGALCAIDGVPRRWKDSDFAKMRKLANFANDQIQLRRALRISEWRRHALVCEIEARMEVEAELQRQAETDPLTGALNRRAFLSRAAAFSGGRRRSDDAAVILVDLDRFKAVNDTYGHSAGDAVLTAVCRRLADSIRTERDLLARFGGEEFVLLLPDTDASGARIVAERCRAAIADNPIVLSETVSLTVTASFGCAQLSANERDVARTLTRADAALYAAKASGRNAVAEPPGPERERAAS